MVIVLVVVLLIVGGVVAAGVFLVNKGSQVVNSAAATANAELTALPTIDTSSPTPTPTTASTGGVPDASQINPTAASKITGVSTALDSNGTAGSPQSSFHTGNVVDITFTVAGTSGYAITKVYRDGQFDIKSNSPLTIQSSDTSDAFSITVNNPGQYVAGIYWCTKSDCSDAALAQVATFSVS